MKTRLKQHCKGAGTYPALTIEPLPLHLTTPIYSLDGEQIAEWVSTNLRQPNELRRVEEALRWDGRDKYLAIRKGNEQDARIS